MSEYYQKFFQEIKTDGIDLVTGLKVLRIEKPEESNNLKLNVFEPNKHETLTLLYVTKNEYN